jgi:hypothetical protein
VFDGGAIPATIFLALRQDQAYFLAVTALLP